jgi:XRE family transcriptional regulator, aerobic/anaerobic benzoate catabolism transcriptional regulator
VKHTAPSSAPSPVLVTLSQRARLLRQQQGMTLRSLAGKSGLSLRFLMDVEAGRGNISIRRLAELAEALKTTAADLVTEHSEDPAPRVITLLGLRGSGKTAVGRRLARRLRMRFVELDRHIEQRAGMRLGEIFAIHGEDFYRRLERETLTDLLSARQSMVLAVGGGLVTAPDTYAHLLRQTTTIWLKTKADDCWTRVMRQGDRRPMEQPQAREALRQLVARRDPLYSRASLTVDTSGATIPQAVDRAERALRVHDDVR